MNTRSPSFTAFGLFVIAPILVLALWTIELTDTSWFSYTPFGWFNITDYYSNGYFQWRLNPLLTFLTSWGGYSPYILICILSYLCGMFTLSKELGATFFTTQWAVLLGALSLLILFGINLPVLSLAALFPWIVWIIITPYKTISKAILVGLISYFAANHLGVLIVGALLPLAIGKEENSGRLNVFLILSFFLLASPFIAPHLVSPVYPSDGRLIPGYGFNLGIDPIISYGSTKPFIDRQHTQSFPIIPSLITGIIGFWIMRLSSDSLVKKLSIALMCISICALLETTLFSPAIRLIAPLQSLSRIIPGLISYPISIYATALAIMLIGIIALIPKHALSAMLGLTAIIVSGVLAQKPQNDFSFGTLINPNTHLASSATNSPSLYLLRHRPYESHRVLNLTIPEWKEISEFNAKLTASHNAEALDAVTSQRTRDRWSTKLGKQDGSECIKIEFPELVKLSGLEISLKKFISDYPRGIEILAGGDCNTLSTLFHEAQWLGTTRITEAGLPYYSHESIIEIPLPPTDARCLVIKQIGRDTNFEWSVEKIRISNLLK